MKEFLGLVAALIGFAGNIPYILFIFPGRSERWVSHDVGVAAI